MMRTAFAVLFLLSCFECIAQTEYPIYQQTTLMFVTAQEIIAPTRKAGGNKVGDTVDIRLKDDFKKDDVILIKKGTKAVAVVREIKVGRKEPLEFNVGSYGKHPSVIAIDILGVTAVDGTYIELSACAFRVFQSEIPIGSVKNCDTQQKVIIKAQKE